MEVEMISHTPNPIGVIAQCAAVCYNSEPNIQVVKSCVESGHMSVLEHSTFTFMITGVSRALLAQITRHRTGIAFSVMSQRYVDMSHAEFVYPDCSNTYQREEEYDAAFAASIESYHNLQKLGVENEDARMVLPNACCTTIAMTVNLRELCHMCNERLCSRAQREIRQLFIKIKNLILNLEDIPDDFKEFMKTRMLVPKCEVHSIPFCEERKSCGKHKSLKQIVLNSEHL